MTSKPDRVVVFIDYQNVYRSARDVYHDHQFDPHFYGQINPQALGEHLAQDSPFDRQLKQVRIYRGLPSSDRDRKGYSACRKQVAAWQQQPNVKVFTRPLQYPDGWPDNCLPGERPNEKGIDVQLALDMAVMAQRKEYEVGILMSLDTDLRPALEYVADMTRAWGKPRIEVAAWSMPGQLNRRLSLLGRQTLYCHWIDEPTYKSVKDTTNYSS
ncbi:NYN domain-containing protein [Mycolicibacterium phlei]